MTCHPFSAAKSWRVPSATDPGCTVPSRSVSTRPTRTVAPRLSPCRIAAPLTNQPLPSLNHPVLHILTTKASYQTKFGPKAVWWSSSRQLRWFSSHIDSIVRSYFLEHLVVVNPSISPSFRSIPFLSLQELLNSPYIFVLCRSRSAPWSAP